MKKELIYLGLPYSMFPDLSFDVANKVAAKLLTEGKQVFSPISHSHFLAQFIPKEKRTSNDFWMSVDIPILKRCDRLTIVVIGEHGHDYIKDSVGCQDEIKEAERLNLPIDYYYFEL